MKLARSSFYYGARAKTIEGIKAEADLRDRIEAICLGSAILSAPVWTQRLR